MWGIIIVSNTDYKSIKSKHFLWSKLTVKSLKLGRVPYLCYDVVSMATKTFPLYYFFNMFNNLRYNYIFHQDVGQMGKLAYSLTSALYQDLVSLKNYCRFKRRWKRSSRQTDINNIYKYWNHEVIKYHENFCWKHIRQTSHLIYFQQKCINFFNIC